jgi:hypothetical protein
MLILIKVGFGLGLRLVMIIADGELSLKKSRCDKEYTIYFFRCTGITRDTSTINSVVILCSCEVPPSAFESVPLCSSPPLLLAPALAAIPYSFSS